MTLQQNSSIRDDFGCLREETLEDLRQFILPTISRWVYFSPLPSWRGQEYDIIQDIVQETLVRFTFYVRQASVNFPERMCLVIAKRYYLDLKRKDFRIDHIIAETFGDEKRQFEEVAIDNVYYEKIFILLAQEISRFPKRQREALLIDIAAKLYFGTTPTALQQAFLAVGIDLRAYCFPIPLDARKRSQHASLLNHAYRRLTNLKSVRQFIVDL